MFFNVHVLRYQNYYSDWKQITNIDCILQLVSNLEIK